MSDTIERINDWFVAAKPNPSKRDFFQQFAVNLEEYSEVLEALVLKDTELYNYLLEACAEVKRDVPDATDEQVDAVHNAIDRTLLADGIADSIVTLVGMAHMLGLDIVGALKEVAASNESKFIKVSGELTPEQLSQFAQECNDIEAQGRYTNVTWKREGDFIVFTDGNGKIVKPSTFREPDLSAFI